jgi:hypothetical protein
MAWLGRMGGSAVACLGTIATLILALGGIQSASAEQRKLLVASFENIQVIGDIDVTVQTGKAPSAVAIGDKRVLDSLKLERIGTTLRVRLQDIVNNNKGVPMSQPLKVMLSTQAMKDVTVSGNGTLSISQVRQQSAVRLLVAGNGSISVGQLETDRFAANIDGNGRISIANGTARDGRLTINGAGVFEGGNVPMRTLRLEHIGNAASSANVLEEANIFNRGSGRIDIAGKGTCFIKQAGNAAINCAKIDKGTRK